MIPSPCWTHSPQNPARVQGLAHPYTSPFVHSIVGQEPQYACPGYIRDSISDEDVERIALRVVELMKGEPEPKEERNPFLPEAPADGQHMFGENGDHYRCSRCGVYNRPQTSNPPYYEPCVGGWAQSSKMRADAERRWAEKKAQ